MEAAATEHIVPQTFARFHLCLHLRIASRYMGPGSKTHAIVGLLAHSLVHFKPQSASCFPDEMLPRTLAFVLPKSIPSCTCPLPLVLPFPPPGPLCFQFQPPIGSPLVHMEYTVGWNRRHDNISKGRLDACVPFVCTDTRQEAWTVVRHVMFPSRKAPSHTPCHAMRTCHATPAGIGIQLGFPV
jgi:hypothetical protein